MKDKKREIFFSKKKRNIIFKKNPPHKPSFP